MADEPQDQSAVVRRRSYWPGIGCLVAAGIAKAVGTALYESAVTSARSSSSFLGSGQRLQQAANIEVATDAVVLILGFIGVVLLICTAVSRSRSKSLSV